MVDKPKQDFETSISSCDTKKEIHVFIFNKFEELGYDRTLELLRKCLANTDLQITGIVHEYLQFRIKKNEVFENYKSALTKVVLELDDEKLKVWSHEMRVTGFSKQEIYDILHELFIYVQFDEGTKEDLSFGDFVADFLDLFTYLGKEYRIFPNDPDCK